MKILLVSVKSEKSKGGIAVWTNRFISQCEKCNIDYSLVNTEAVGERQTKGSAKRNFFDEFIRTRRIFSDLKKTLKDQCDVAHINTSCGTFGLIRDYYITKRIKKENIKTVVHYHCDIPFWVKNKFSRYYLKKLLSVSDLNMILCNNSAEFLKKEFYAESVKVPNFVDSSIVINEEKQINEKITKVCFVGSITKSKGVFEIFEAAKRYPDIIFSLIGVVGQEIEQSSKPRNVIFEGSFDHKRVVEFLDSSDLFIFPSHSEGFSMALAESMARGLPAIATDVGANRDMIEDCGGIIVEVGDVNGIINALEKMQDKKVRSEISHHFVEKVKANYTTDVVFDKINANY